MARSYRNVRNIIVVGLILGALYFATRLLNLTILPIFTDEAIYIRWSQIGSRDAAWRFISLVDGKQPMFTWIMMVFLKFIKDPLIAGRLVSVFSGFFSMIGVWILSFELFRSKKLSFLASVMYLVSPFTLMYDRMALYDSLVSTFYIWNMYLAILLARKVRLDVALIFGMTLGAGMLNKSSGLLSLYLVPASLLLFDWKKKDLKKRLCIWVGFILIAAFLSQVIYAVLRLSPLFSMVSQKNVVFIYSFGEWLSHPFKFVEGNIKGLFDWLIHYLTWPVFILSLLSVFTMKGKWKETVLLLTWWFAPFFALAMFGRVLYPRFILFMAMPLLVLAAKVGFGHLRLILFGLLIIPCLWVDWFIVTNPKYAPITFSDKSQMIDDWPSGWGVREVNAFITNESKQGPVTIYTEGTFGLFPYAIEMYQVDNPRVTVKGIWPVPGDLPLEIATSAKNQPTYMIFNQTQVVPSWPMELVAQYQKGNREDQMMRLYKILLVQ